MNQLKEFYDNIIQGNDVRKSLSSLNQIMKEKTNRKAFFEMTGGNYDPIMRCLASDDAKTRKNAATLLGLLRVQDALDVIYDAYEAEEKRFVKAEYINAMARLRAKAYLPQLKKRLEELIAYQPAVEEEKHVREEITALQNLVLEQEGLKTHTFAQTESCDVILATLPALAPVVAAEITEAHKVLKGGVRVNSANIMELAKIRPVKEILFCLKYKVGAKALPDSIAMTFYQSDLMDVLKKCHKEDAPFYFRLGILGNLSLEERSKLTRQTVAAIESIYDHKLINSASNYEIELRVVLKADGSFLPFLKLYTIPDHRFDYRKEHVAASMNPVTAASLIELAKPYLREHTQVLDPFCGVGTLLIERNYAMSTRSIYGIDIFGEAIEKARKNTGITGMTINFINRDYFDFTHSYLFDEIITDLPSFGIGDKEEADAFYRRFLEHSEKLLNEDGRIFVFLNQKGTFYKQLRLHPQYRLLKEFEINAKAGSCFMIIEHR